MSFELRPRCPTLKMGFQKCINRITLIIMTLLPCFVKTRRLCWKSYCLDGYKDPSSRAVCGQSFAGIMGWKPTGGMMSVSYECCMLSGRGLCDGPITRPGESYRVWRVWGSPGPVGVVAPLGGGTFCKSVIVTYVCFTGEKKEWNK